MSEQERCPECHRPGWQRCNFDGCPGWRQAAPTPLSGKWKLVPVEPTLKMLAAAEVALNRNHWDYIDEEVWKAMLAAAPTPPAEPPEDVAGLIADGWRRCAVGQGTSQFCEQAERLAAERDALREAAKQWERLAVKWPEAAGLPAPANEEESLRAWLATAGGKTLDDLLNLMRERLVLVTRAELNRAALARAKEGK